MSNTNSSEKNRSRIANVKRMMLGQFSQLVLNMLLPFITRTIMIYTLGNRYLGISGLFASILQVLNLAELGFGEAMVFSLYKPMAEQDTPRIQALLRLYRRVNRVIGLIIAGAGLALLPFLPYLIADEVPPDVSLSFVYLTVLSGTCISYLSNGYRSALFFSDQRSEVISYKGCMIQLSDSLLRLLILVIWKNYHLYCLVSPLMAVADIFCLRWLSRKYYPDCICAGEVSKEDKTAIWKKISGLFIAKISWVFRNAFDTVTISAFMGLVSVALYQNYYFILQSVTKLTTLLSGSALSSVGNSIALESQEKNFRDFRKLQLLFMWFAGWCTACMLCLYQPFIRLWTGETGLFSNGAMVVFCVYYFVDMAGNLPFVYRQAAGLYQYRKWVPVLESVVNITLNILLVRQFGVIGVLLSTIFCQVIINLPWNTGILFQYYFTDYRRRDYLVRLGGYALLTAAACGVCWLVCGLLPFTGLAQLIANGCVCLVVPNLVLFAGLHLYPEYGDAMTFLTTRLLKR